MLTTNVRETKALFFDKKAVLDSVGKGTRKALSKAGAFIRRRARSSIRKRKKSSPPGQPPSSHEGSLKRLLFFAYDPKSGSVVVGPVPFRKGEAPRLLERGGTVVRQKTQFRTRGGEKVRERVPVRMVYRGNPFMRPAGLAEMKSETFRSLLRGMAK